MIDNLQVSPRSIDCEECKMLMCWDFQGPLVQYAGRDFDVTALLFDVKPGQCWYLKPWLQEVLVVDGQSVQIEGTFRHCSCLRVSLNNEPWDAFTCSMCASIPYQIDFKFRVLREDKCTEKRGTQSTKGGRRLGYLSLAELTLHSRSVATKLRVE